MIELIPTKNTVSDNDIAIVSSERQSLPEGSTAFSALMSALQLATSDVEGELPAAQSGLQSMSDHQLNQLKELLQDSGILENGSINLENLTEISEDMRGKLEEILNLQEQPASDPSEFDFVLPQLSVRDQSLTVNTPSENAQESTVRTKASAIEAFEKVTTNPDAIDTDDQGVSNRQTQTVVDYSNQNPVKSDDPLIQDTDFLNHDRFSQSQESVGINTPLNTDGSNDFLHAREMNGFVKRVGQTAIENMDSVQVDKEAEISEALVVEPIGVNKIVLRPEPQVRTSDLTDDQIIDDEVLIEAGLPVEQSTTELTLVEDILAKIDSGEVVPVMVPQNISFHTASGTSPASASTVHTPSSSFLGFVSMIQQQGGMGTGQGQGFQQFTKFEMTEQTIKQQISRNLNAVTNSFNELLTLEGKAPEKTERLLGDLGVSFDRRNSLPSGLQSIQYSVRSPQWGQALGQRVVYMANNKIQEAKITLNPEKLGPIQIKIHVDRDNQISVAMSAHHNATRDALDGAIPRLREMLENAGISFSDVDVSTDSHFDGGEFEQQHQEGKGSRFQTVEEAADESPVLPVYQSDSLVDYYA